MKLQRKQARDLKIFSNLLEHMNKLDGNNQLNLRASRFRLSRNIEQKTFHEALPSELASVAAEMRKITDISEHAMQETLRIQALHLGAIEEAFNRLKEKQDYVEQLHQAIISQNSDSHPTSPIDTNQRDRLSQLLPAERENLKELKESVVNQLKDLEPKRSLFAANSIGRCCVDAQKLASESRLMWESLLNRLNNTRE